MLKVVLLFTAINFRALKRAFCAFVHGNYIEHF